MYIYMHVCLKYLIRAALRYGLSTTLAALVCVADPLPTTSYEPQGNVDTCLAVSAPFTLYSMYAL